MNRQQKHIVRIIFGIMAISLGPSIRAMQQQKEIPAEDVCFKCTQDLPEVKIKNPFVVKLECGHNFHRTCLLPLLKESQPHCSLCPKMLTDGDKKKIEIDTVSPDPLAQLCIRLILDNKIVLTQALLNLPDDVFDHLFKALPEKLRIAQAQAVTAAANSPGIDVARGCSLLLKRPDLQCSALEDRIAELVRANGFLPDPVLQFLIERFDVSAIMTKLFHELLPQGLSVHKQAGAIIAAFVKKHWQDVKRGRCNWNCFALRPSNGPVPADLVFIPDPMEATYENQRALVSSKKDGSVYATYGRRYGDRDSGPIKATRCVDKTLLALRPSGSAVIEIHKVLPSGGRLMLTNIVLVCYSDFDTCDLIYIKEIAFSSDNSWLRTIDVGDKVAYFKLPRAYINEQLTLDQIVFMRVFNT